MNIAEYMRIENGEPFLSSKGALMYAAMAAYEDGNPNGEAIVDRALALAEKKGYSGGADFRSAFRRFPCDQAERVKQVEAVFAVIGDWEFVYGVFGAPVGVQWH